jgi:hypothetical protein
MKFYFNSTQSQWSRIKIKYKNNCILLKCIVKVTTNSFNLQSIKPHYEERIREVINLSELGYSNKEISEIFNKKGYQKWVSNTPFNRFDIGMIKQKHKKRLLKQFQTIEIGKWEIDEWS